MLQNLCSAFRGFDLMENSSRLVQTQSASGYTNILANNAFIELS